MALINDVQKIWKRLATKGWRELLAKHGLKIPADVTPALLKKRLLNTELTVDRTVKGFEDFAIEGKHGITPGSPARSLFYHALASPNIMEVDGTTLRAFPSLEDLDTVENFVFGAVPTTLKELRSKAGNRELSVVVFACEYRPSKDTSHRKHADLVFSRTGVARVGTKYAVYDGRRRGFLPFVDGDVFQLRVLPARYVAFLAVQLKGNSDEFRPMRFQDGDQNMNFWVPVHKLFSGKECLKDATAPLEVEYTSRHVNEKIHRAHKVWAARNHDSGWSGDDINRPPFRFEEKIAEIANKPAHGPGLVVPTPHTRLVEPAVYKNKPLTFIVPSGAARLSSTVEIPATLIPGQRARPAPEYVHARRLIEPDETEVDLNDVEDVKGFVNGGGYRALHYVDFTGDGSVQCTCNDIPGNLKFVAAYSLVTAPDYFLTASQRELTEWSEGLSSDLRDSVWQTPPDALSDERFAPNVQLPASPFSANDKTVTAIVSLFGDVSTAPQQPFSPDPIRHSHLPDEAAGIFAPGWDTSVDIKDGSLHLSAYGLGSPFPEDAKLCAALSTFWPAAAPDATRAMEPGLARITVSPLTDEEIGIVGNLPWDGVRGPRVVVEAGVEFAEYASFDHVDYVSNALDGAFTLALTSRVGAVEYQNRVLAMALVYRAIRPKPPSSQLVLSFRKVTVGDPELILAQNEALASLPGQVVRFELIDLPADFQRQNRIWRIRVTNKTLLFADPTNRIVLIRRPGQDWKKAKLDDV